MNDGECFMALLNCKVPLKREWKVQSNGNK